MNYTHVHTRSGASEVAAWEQDVTLPTYPVPAPDKNPMFLDKRVYQGSSGRVYPNPVTDRLSDHKIEKSYKALFLENPWLRVMILPEIGGRIHIAQDKTNGYDFFYQQHVIKPALVGLLGPWISGGVEFNWPQHHRPSTFMPVDYFIEKHDDGSQTVWLSEHEPMNRMKGMVGICLYPDKAFIEAKVRLYNRTPFVQTFLWWANAAVHVHEDYETFFPPDVAFVADHAKRAVSWYPIARNFYYGVDYTRGVNIAWYKNIPVPTSYMVLTSRYDFLGGYDHKKQAGVVLLANHHIAPGKKLWTWGNAEFGYAWDRELTDHDGPYVELMSGVYTDNQPDFSWLNPYETKTFSQFWYPIQQIGPVKNANRRLAVNLESKPDAVRIGVCATEVLHDLKITLTYAGNLFFEQIVSIAPGHPFLETISVSHHIDETAFELRVFDSKGNQLIRYSPERRSDVSLPAPATEPPPPEDTPINEELYLIGLHLEQYRHATRSPEPYWEEALRRDPSDARCHNALGLLKLRRGKFAEAETHFQKSISRLTARNPNPYDGEPFYYLGLAAKFQGKLEQAYQAFYKAAWNYNWQAASYYALAEIDCARGHLETALNHARQSQRTAVDHLKARNLETAILRHLGRTQEARETAMETTRIDPLDFWSHNELVLLLEDPAECQAAARQLTAFMRRSVQTCLDIAFDYANAGLWMEAADLITRFLTELDEHERSPMLFYAAAYFAQQLGNTDTASRYYLSAAQVSPDYCFPSRLEELIILQSALQHAPDDARAHYYLGNLLYDKSRRDEAIAHWEKAVHLDPSYSVPARNLGIAYYNVRHDPARALASYEHAFRANPSDARLLYELDQLRKRIGIEPQARLHELERHRHLVDQRDDLTLELVTLYNQLDQPERALSLLESRRFHPWEGGEGLVSGQYVAAHLILGRAALLRNQAAEALRHFEAARRYPPNLGEGKHLLTLETDLDYFSGLALSLLGRTDEAAQNWEAAAKASPGNNRYAYYRAMALFQLGDKQAAISALEHLLEAAEKQMQAKVKIDYFATSLPNFLLFEDDLQKRNQIDSLFLRALAFLGLGNLERAAEDLKRTLELDKNHLWAHVELTYTLETRGEETVAKP
jgi:tetratricopeptide (TPR) repeat protein